MAKRGSVFDSALWTGRREDKNAAVEHAYATALGGIMYDLAQDKIISYSSSDSMQEPAVAPAPASAPLKYSPTPADLSVPDLAALREYADLCASIGVSGPAIEIEDFKVWLAEKDWPVYDLKTVIEFMDAKAKAEGRGWGWNWAPLRLKDSAMIKGIVVGRAAQRGMMDIDGRILNIPASNLIASNINVYTLPVPAHALRKVKAIEDSGFAGKVAFFVSDYAPAPAFRPDPFLLALIPNPEAHKGNGLFVIDVWDEPGFGLESMLR